jgi:hypothetical protein
LTAEEAESVARRHDPAPAIIIVDAQAAHEAGVVFYRSGPLFLVENGACKIPRCAVSSSSLLKVGSELQATSCDHLTAKNNAYALSA